MYRRAPALEDHGHILADLPVHVGQNAVHGLHDRHLTAHGLIDAGQLHADHPAADDDQGPVHPLLVREHLVRGDGVLQTGDRGPGGYGAGGDEDMVRLILRSIHQHPVLRQNGPRAPEKAHLLLPEQSLHAGAELLRHLCFLPVDGCKVHGEAFRGNPPFPAPFQARGDLCGVEQAFGGDAAPVEAGAAHVPALHNGGSDPQLGGAEGGLIAPGPRANNK